MQIKRSKESIAKAWTWQKEQIRLLSKMTFEKLSGLPERQELNPPVDLVGLTFFLRRSSGECGGVLVKVCEYTRSPTGRLRPKFAHLKYLESTICLSFEMLPNGEIIWPDLSHDPTD